MFVLLDSVFFSITTLRGKLNVRNCVTSFVDDTKAKQKKLFFHPLRQIIMLRYRYY